MKAIVSFVAVLLLVAIGYMGGSAGSTSRFLFGVVAPYSAFAIFVVFMIVRILKWASSPVPFRIPTTAGQQKTLPWIKDSKIENPSSVFGVVIRMALEVLVFRSLFRNLKTQLHEGGRLAYGEAKWLWMAGLAFHYSFAIILFRHLRFFLEKVPYPIQLVESLDSFLQIGAPLLYLTDVALLGAVTYLFIRRVALPQVKYISLIADYFPLFLIFAIGATGVLMRYFTKTDIVGVKTLAMGLISFNPAVPETIGAMFYTHVFLLSVLFAYFPFSKLVHMGGVFMSPTRNMANTSREKRHINPWNYPVHVHTYEEYENDFRDKMKEAGLPVEKE
ncbi:MAG: sulfate reduction electron transfer complex DsrMKJOP subunit DsrM [Nitrospiraceae bacterium]|nr:sulfate reduction electron transfer complex DsrMKJOP subunit DsrM [Nitrospiraceae bacterium]